MIGKHMAAAIQGAGAAMGGAYEKKAIMDYESQREDEKYRQQEEALDKRLNAQIERSRLQEAARNERFYLGEENKNARFLTSEEAKTARTEMQLESREGIAAASRTIAEKRNELMGERNQISKEKNEIDKGGDYKPSQQIDDLSARVRRNQDKLSGMTAMADLTDADRANIRKEMERDEAELNRLMKKHGDKGPELPGVRYDQGLVGQGMGAKRGSDKPAAVSNNQPMKSAPPSAIAALKADPSLAEQFKQKYGYLP